MWNIHIFNCVYRQNMPHRPIRTNCNIISNYRQTIAFYSLEVCNDKFSSRPCSLPRVLHSLCFCSVACFCHCIFGQCVYTLYPICRVEYGYHYVSFRQKDNLVKVVAKRIEQKKWLIYLYIHAHRTKWDIMFCNNANLPFIKVFCGFMFYGSYCCSLKWKDFTTTGSSSWKKRTLQCHLYNNNNNKEKQSHLHST